VFDGGGTAAGVAVAILCLGAAAGGPALAFRCGHRALAWMLVAIPAGLSLFFVPMLWLSG
jgi:hypothetical protein